MRKIREVLRLRLAQGAEPAGARPKFAAERWRRDLPDGDAERGCGGGEARFLLRRYGHQQLVVVAAREAEFEPLGSGQGTRDAVCFDRRAETGGAAEVAEVSARAVHYRRERWLTPDGTMIVAPLPGGIGGHFGPEQRRFVLMQYHQGQVTVERLVSLLQAVGVSISKRRLNFLSLPPLASPLPRTSDPTNNPPRYRTSPKRNERMHEGRE